MKFINQLKQNYLLVCILALAVFLRIYKADFQSIWCDEILSMNNSNPKLTLTQLYDNVLFWEYIPHLYFFLLRFVFEIFGYTTLVARIFSAFIGIGGVFGMYLLGKEIYNKNVGLVAALFLSVNFFHISYSQEIRPYGLLFLFTVLSFYRLIIFIKNSNLRNAILYGIFTGLIINSHFFGFITIFAQYILLLFFLIQTPKIDRKKFFIFSFISGLTTLLVLAPGFAAIKRMTEISSFWLAPPTAEVYTNMFKEFFGNSEMVLFVVNPVFIFYIICLFREKQHRNDLPGIINNKMIFSFIILFVWLIISLVIPVLKSHLDVSMIINRYFISVVGILILVLAIGIQIIKNKWIQAVVIIYIVLFSIIDLFAIKKYYSTVSKSQFRELTDQIREKNPDNVKIVAFWSWLFPYFYQNEPEIQIEGKLLEDYVNDMKVGNIKQKPFWYADANFRPYTMSPEGQAYLDQNFNLVEKIELHDAWANYYVPKVENKINIKENLDLSIFKPSYLDDKGNILFFENTNARTSFMKIEKGNYNLIIKGNSLPAKKINGENAHIKIRINSTEIGQFNLSEDINKQVNTIPFTYDKDEKIRIQLIYDNDLVVGNDDRNVIIYSIKLEKR
jgi:hypothetical protein